REALLADVLRLQERLERLGLVELAEDAQLLVVVRLLVGALELLLEPVALLVVADVHVLDADRAAVRVAQHAEDVAELGLALAAEAARDDLSLEVPEREAVRLDLEVMVLALLVGERVDVGHEVAAHAVGVDELLHARRLVDALGEVDRDIRVPADGRVRNAQRREDVLVEAVLTDEQLMHDLQELARARALDDAVVV